MSDKRFALLIDSDNISAKYIDSILDEMTRHGVATYRRIYGDFTDYHMNKWKSELAERSITPIQQFRNTTGKNATDSALIIDAMDILYAGNVEGFCIVSSDGDFTRLASRLRESGMEVITTNENNGKDTGLGEIGSALVKKYSDFDVRNYGYSSLSRFIEDLDNFELKRNHTSIQVILKNDAKEVEQFMVDTVKKAGVTGIDIGQLAQKVYDHFPNFKVKKLGYATFQKLVHSIRALQVENVGNNQKNVYLKR